MRMKLTQTFTPDKISNVGRLNVSSAARTAGLTLKYDRGKLHQVLTIYADEVVVPQ